ncbi:Os05g0210201 [Oryza sativa Japonica Group]|uniref:Os05g0210201 protein n=1 Tax=Oryza sativa subsp. japonica TaxID=39947 RepID=A0A0P0WJ97_ORYSJ|nr:hypothetical protein EE612_027815 [Oryza sativa]BAS92788.1 Os05g0210201 [Oryza sativa Japonica Group]
MVCLTSSNHWSWTFMEVLKGGMLQTLLSLKYLRSRAVAPMTAKLAPWLKLVPLFADGGSSGSPNASARKSMTRRPLEQRAYGGGNLGMLGSLPELMMTKLPVSEKESPKLNIAL